jgi:hypothetical protein
MVMQQWTRYMNAKKLIFIKKLSNYQMLIFLQNSVSLFPDASHMEMLQNQKNTQLETF